MRCLFEVVAIGADVAKFPRRNGGGTEEVPFFWISGLDVDYMDQLVKLKVFRPKNQDGLKKLAQKGSKLQVRFRTLKRDDKFEHCTVITVAEEDLSAHAPNGTQHVTQPLAMGVAAAA